MTEAKAKKGIIPANVRAELEKPFPPEAITGVETKAYLSTVKAIYILERLNDVFGVGGWQLDFTPCLDYPVSDFALVKGRMTVPEYNYTGMTQYGGHKTGGTGTDPADGWKSAVTDCLSKCASQIGVAIDVFKGQQTHKNKESFLPETKLETQEEQDLPKDEKQKVAKPPAEKPKATKPKKEETDKTEKPWKEQLNDLMVKEGFKTAEEKTAVYNYFQIEGFEERAISVITNWDARIQQYKDTLGNQEAEKPGQQELDWDA